MEKNRIGQANNESLLISLNLITLFMESREFFTLTTLMHEFNAEMMRKEIQLPFE